MNKTNIFSCRKKKSQNLWVLISFNVLFLLIAGIFTGCNDIIQDKQEIRTDQSGIADHMKQITPSLPANSAVLPVFEA